MSVRIQPKDGGSYEYVHKGAIMKCDKGTVPCQLKPTPKSVHFARKNPATEIDKIPIVNNFDFGVCAITQKPCKLSVAPEAWEDVKEEFNLEGHRPLLDKSTIPCALGGKIVLLTSGQ